MHQPAMATFWHTTAKKYRPGDDLLCWNTLEAESRVSDADWKWPDAPVGSDGHVVSLWREDERGDADWLAREFDGVVLRVDVPDDRIGTYRMGDWEPEDESVLLTTIVEGLSEFAAAYARIPGQYVTLAA